MALRDHFDRRYMIGAADGPFPHGACARQQRHCRGSAELMLTVFRLVR